MDEEVKKYKIFKNIAAREYYGAAEPPVRCGEVLPEPMKLFL